MVRGLSYYLLILVLLAAPALSAQRHYAPASVLAEGQWYQLAIPETGVYVLSSNQVRQAGFTLPLPSDALRIYGRSGNIPGEAAASSYEDDLREIALQVMDGGDGLFQEGDSLFFYAEGPHPWTWDTVASLSRRYTNIYSDTAFVYLTSGSGGKRIAAETVPAAADHTITTYQFRYHHELDSVNLLASGQGWLGESFRAEGSMRRSFGVPWPRLVEGSDLFFSSGMAARAVGNTAVMEVNLGAMNVLTHSVAGVSASNLDLFAREDRQEAWGKVPAGPLPSLEYAFRSGNAAALGWLNNFSLVATAELRFREGEQLDFRQALGASAGRIGQYAIQGAPAGLQVWRVSDPLSPVTLPGQTEGAAFLFRDRHEKVQEYIAFRSGLRPVLYGPVSNQNLHGAAIPQMIILTTPELTGAAGRLADWHRVQDGLQVLVVSASQVYHEFSAGQPSPVAIRDMVKMFYDRARASGEAPPSYLLLLGDASYDFKNRNGRGNSYLPSYQSAISLDPLSTYVSDDFFGFLDDAEDINSGLVTNLLDIGIGRIPVSDAMAAERYIDKLVAYNSPATLGPWRNEMTLVADDEDNNLHLQDAEVLSAAGLAANPGILQQKLYLDAFAQESSAGGARYPELVNQQAVLLQKGQLIWNYSGHGGYRRLAEEVVLDQEVVDSWQQEGKLPLFITATCDFAPFDNQAIASLGESLLLKPGAGDIALMTTTRLVFAYSNRVMNQNYLQVALSPLPDGTYRTLGEAVMAAKNKTYETSGDIYNNRKFTLLGDPALRLAFPRYGVKTLKVNGVGVEAGLDSLKALQEVSLEGAVTSGGGQVLTDFNGSVSVAVLDRPYTLQTRGNDAGSEVQEFEVQDRALFRGKATVTNGLFRVGFLVPRDILYAPGRLKVSYYATDGSRDAGGSFDELVVAGSVTPPLDEEGPVIAALLNDSSFQDGGVVGPSPVLRMTLADPSGINVVGNGIGHDITIELNVDPSTRRVLNSFFEADRDRWQSGTVQYRFSGLAEGEYHLKIKAWDQVNNSSEHSLRFRVKDELVVDELRIWPNPSSGAVRFVLDHNQARGELQAEMQVYTLAGRLVKKINGTIIASANRSYMDWNGADEEGKRLAPGIYICRLHVRTGRGKQDVIVRKLVRI